MEIDTVVVSGQNNSIAGHAATERAVRIFRAYFHALTDASSHAESRSCHGKKSKGIAATRMQLLRTRDGNLKFEWD